MNERREQKCDGEEKREKITLRQNIVQVFKRSKTKINRRGESRKFRPEEKKEKMKQEYPE